MGKPVNPIIRPFINNGGFDADVSWAKGPNVTIANGVCRWDGINAFATQIAQGHNDFVSGELYKVEMDILQADFLGLTAVRFFINGVTDFESPKFTTTGHKVWTFTPNATNFFFEIRISNAPDFPYVCVIDNVSCEINASVLAFEQSLLPMPGVKTDQNSSAVGSENVLLAHWNGKSNVIIEIE